MNFYKALLCSFLLLSICSCAVVPTFTEKFDNKCQTVQKKVVLSTEVLGPTDGFECPDKDACIAKLSGHVIGSVIIYPLSAIFSGTIAMVGNSYYWVNELGQCKA